MKLKFWFFTLILISVILVVEYDISRRTQARVEATLRKPSGALAQMKRTAQVQADTTLLPTSESSPFEKKFKSEVQEIARLQADPAEVEIRLDRLAQNLTDGDIVSLQRVMMDSEGSGDDRALAVEVLSRKKTPESLAALESFVKNHQTTNKKNWSRPQEFNSVITAQAIEGIAAYPVKEKALTSLDALARTVDETFLLDRIARSKENLNGNAPPTDQQDDAALKKLIE